MNLLEKLKTLEKQGGEFHDYIHSVMFGSDTYENIAQKIDENFRFCLKDWRERNFSASLMGANILIQTMAVMNTREYKHQKNNLDELAEELDCDYTPGELTEFLEPRKIFPNRLNNARMKTRVRRGLLDAKNLCRKEEKYVPLVDYLQKLYALMTKQ